MIASGQIRPSVEVLQSLANRLGKPISFFLEGLPGSRADALLLLNLAIAHLEQDDVDKARPLLQQAEQFSKDHQDARLQGLVQMQFCRLTRLEGDFDGAERRGTQALKLLQKQGEPVEIAQAMMYLGNMASVRRDLYEALARYQDALVVAKGTADSDLLCRLHLNLGSLLIQMEDWEPADAHLQTAMSMATATTSVERRVKMQVSLALTCREKGDLDRALELSGKALASINEVRKPYLVADIYNHMGSIHATNGNHQSARKCFQMSLEVLQDQPVYEQVEALYELARLSLADGCIEQALQEARTALQCAEKVGVPVELGRCALVYAQALLSADEASKAVPYLQTAVRIFQTNGLRQSLVVARDMLKYATAERKGDLK